MREQLIQHIANNPNYRQMCRKISVSYADDIFQEVCCEILTMPENRLPDFKYLNFWFYRVASNMFTCHGVLGKVIHKPTVDIPENETNELTHEEMIKEAERFMFSLDEFENRVILLYNQLGDMKKVQRATGISYSALRTVKEKMKQLK